ncbi:hypothetical protein [Aliiroseovarius sediminis]|uniref:hypothetical protein n=1 Tax=Aliiroseovarius sediminis TaxID=2925839 RepID=UPI001F57D368|nr:hypothetical protein [Aliiroseovarius sediminis]MCI2394364.1 hypothetical protein [Aliiroseovarius sediminis]
MAQSKSIARTLITWFKSALSFTKQERFNLEQHRDMWTGKRSEKLEKAVRHYSFPG